MSEWEYGTCVYTAEEYSFNCFRYIHDNPLSAGLVNSSPDWKWSSYRFYAGIDQESICNMEFAKRFCGYDLRDFNKNHNLDEHWTKIIEGEN